MPKNFSCKTILDIGGGEGEHANYVKHEHDNYLVLDKRKIQDKADINIEFIIGDAEEIPIHDESVDRVVITCLLHHVEDPQKVLAEMWRSIKLGGIATILLPHDPGFLYRTLQTLTTFQSARRKGLLDTAKLVHALEHRNHYWSSEKQIGDFLNKQNLGSNIIKRRYQFGKVFWQANLFTVIQVIKN